VANLAAFSDLDLTILIPCLNEARTIGACIDKANSYLIRAGLSAEVLVSDNGSTDGSIEIASKHGARVVNAPLRGYGGALLHGIQEAKGGWVVMADGDESYDFGDLGGFVKALQNGAQLVIGDRFAGGIAPGAMPPLHRFLGNPVLSWMGRLFFRVSIRDFHCGIRGFDRSAIQSLGLRCTGMEFATEMIAKAALAGLVIGEVPTTLKPDGRDRAPHLRTWRDGWRHLLFMLLITPRWLFLFPGLVAVTLGAAGLLSLSAEALHVGGVGLDIHTLLYSGGLLIIGMLLVQFAVVVRWLAVQAGLAREPLWLTFTKRHLSIEIGLLVGGLLFFAGFFWSYEVLREWAWQGYGVLDPRLVMRHTIPAVTLMIVGLQACASVFLIGAIHLVLANTRKPMNVGA
jgi:glycosyltransferase involved in cell wall biosynthesis